MVTPRVSPPRTASTTTQQISVPSAEALERPTGAVVKIENIVLEAVDPIDGVPVALLKFEMVNSTRHRIGDIVLQIVIVDKAAIASERLHHVLAGPILIRTKYVLNSEFTMTYEMRLRNLVLDDNCSADIQVRSVRVLADSPESEE